MARKQAFAFHHYAVRGDVRPVANVSAVKQHSRASNCSAAANPYMIDLEHAVFKGVRLELTTHGRSVLEVQHIRVNHLSESAPKYHPSTYLRAHRSQIPREQQCAFNDGERASRIKRPCYVKKIPTTAPA